jgi:iron only hydrogenase large subunit-like protein
MIKRIQNKETEANFFEGMGCPGGCVGGPKVILDRDTGRRYVNEYGKDAPFATPLENPYVMKLLEESGFDTIEALVEKSDWLIRDLT